LHGSRGEAIAAGMVSGKRERLFEHWLKAERETPLAVAPLS